MARSVYINIEIIFNYKVATIQSHCTTVYQMLCQIFLIKLYFQSKEKMKRGSRRGCIRLKRAIIGIDDEDDCTFTIRVDNRIFHFQGFSR